MRESEMEAADFSEATLDRAKLGRAKLRNAAFYGAHGDHVSMIGADLTGIRAGEGGTEAAATAEDDDLHAESLSIRVSA